MEKLRNINGPHGGFEKHWPLKDGSHYNLLYDYLQKINFSIQDFNSIIDSQERMDRKDIVYALTLINWISDAEKHVEECYSENVLSGFTFSKENDLKNAREYLSAVRSYVLAHPLKTDRHRKYGFDGDYICVDIVPYTRYLEIRPGIFRRITLNGLEYIQKPIETDVFLKSYSKEDGAAFSQYIEFDLSDARDVASLCIDRLHEFDKYIQKLKKRDFLQE